MKKRVPFMVTAAAAGLCLLIAGYQPAHAQTGNAIINGKNTTIHVTPSGAGTTQNGTRVYFQQGSAVGLTQDGKTVIRLQPAQPQTYQPTRPTYNFTTAQQYIDEASNASKMKNYQEMIYISEEALSKIDQGKLKATKEEKQRIEHRKNIGYDMLSRKEN